MGHIGACRSRLVAAALLVGACGGRDALIEPAGVPRANAPKAAADAYCAGFGACCSSRGFSFDAAACKTRLSVLTADGICPASSVYDPVAAEQCYAEITTALSSCNAGVSQTNSACSRMCKGTIAAGSSCSHVNECAAPANGTAMCSYINGATTGTCLTQTLLKLGDTCNETCTDPGSNGSLCILAGTPAGSVVLEARVCSRNAGLYCSMELTCKAVIKIGDACLNAECEMGTHCSQSTYVCVADAEAGGPCPAGNECVHGTYCGADHVCAPKKAAGETCQANTECEGVCDASNHCLGGNSPTLNVTAASCAGATQ